MTAVHGLIPEQRPVVLPPLTVAYGGGGPLGIAWGLGIAETLAGAGVPLGSAPALGTSAGSWVAACMALGVPFTVMSQMPSIRVPNPRRGLLHGIARDIFGGAYAPSVRASACRLPDASRVMLCGSRSPVADLIAASSAVPWLFAPHHVGRALYVDGGVRSMVSADLAVPARELLVIAPLAGPMLGAAGWGMERQGRDEMAAWRTRTGGNVRMIVPSRAVADLVRHPLDLFDKPRSCAAYDLAVEQALELVRDRAFGIAGPVPTL